MIRRVYLMAKGENNYELPRGWLNIGLTVLINR